ncbi:hypothetical protein [Streptantibioticus cattleyicolor]|uniref:Uncharacterized protein n=1 Tax=Streptantibioticus cattleyicolor (strain ATCC 35852 / DSM 46488 / JCM 4925 / NBRC 14057 / NRRL 8057) TaxID=1003195 RepID=F8JJT6_STREN|nr:hypothetical protein [Streptantibioticus cattleyicolor]AEW98637.1 hypothetical protein SCATT_p04440 [Streptantibioticus cattleyicolor NRRL 8057 = DSM 46488]CCB72303.1 exported protein of unknown function [Streptantibioticus cattleyicolor NRRL 8057 = DSM 46488]
MNTRIALVLALSVLLGRLAYRRPAVGTAVTVAATAAAVLLTVVR